MTARVSATARQQAALRFIAGWIEAKGYGPSRAEIAAGLGLGSKGEANRLVDALVERGQLRRLRRLDRALEPLAPVAIPRAPDGAPLHFIPFGD